MMPVFKKRGLIGLLILAGILACSAIGWRISTARDMARDRDKDNGRIQAILSALPDPPLDKFVTRSPYEVDSEYDVAASTRQILNVHSSFIDEALGLDVDIAIHRCHPRATDRLLNLVDGSRDDQCTSGGVLTVVDLQHGEKFEVYFKLVGTPNGTMGWNARQLLSSRGNFGTWYDSLDLLRQGLPRYEITQLPATVFRTAGRLESRAADPPHAVLLSGNEEEMLKLLAFRGVFREFYENPNSHQAKYVTRMLIDALLESPQ
jgi:hypothetical protein